MGRHQEWVGLSTLSLEGKYGNSIRYEEADACPALSLDDSAQWLCAFEQVTELL